MTTTYEEVLELFRQVAEAQKETDRILKEQSQATDRKINRLEYLFNSQWSRLVESLVAGDLVELLNQWHIPVNDIATRVKGKYGNGQNFEFDIIAHNGEAIVVVEVKTTLRPHYVDQFMEKLSQLKIWLPRYSHNTVYGAMAWLGVDAQADQMLENRGLLNIRATGDSASIQNAPGFTPRSW